MRYKKVLSDYKKAFWSIVKYSKKSYHIANENLAINKELLWANYFHDSIKGRKYIESLSLNPGRWAVDYSYLYVLNRILSEYKPTKIIEFGLGESSKLVSTYLSYYLFESTHHIIEHDVNWRNKFLERFELSDRSKISICPITTKSINGESVNSYDNILPVVDDNYDLFLIDGPFGSPKYSRYDIVDLINLKNNKDEFIILFDDTNRSGEKDTIKEIFNCLRAKGIKFYSSEYIGVKSVTVIATEMYKYAVSF
jgi:hypothetical protein